MASAHKGTLLGRLRFERRVFGDLRDVLVVLPIALASEALDLELLATAGLLQIATRSIRSTISGSGLTMKGPGLKRPRGVA